MRQGIPNQDFVPVIQVTIDDAQVTVSDNGIGMTAKEIETHFWYAGSSGKNTDEAKAAGVVGTFGIGAMANFGVADELFVETESAVIGERTFSSVRKSELSTETESILLIPKQPRGEPGTTVRALLSAERTMSVHDARVFLRGFVEFVDIPVWFNGEKLSGASHRSALPSERHFWSKRLPNTSVAGIISGDLEILGHGHRRASYRA